MASVTPAKRSELNAIYIATTGINFDGLKGKPRVEKGEPIPPGVPTETMKDLLANGDIKEAK